MNYSVDVNYHLRIKTLQVPDAANRENKHKPLLILADH